ncbi:hypothetical protein [Methanogenium cariaci]|jgi:hypothetical protein
MSACGYYFSATGIPVDIEAKLPESNSAVPKMRNNIGVLHFKKGIFGWEVKPSLKCRIQENPEELFLIIIGGYRSQKSMECY